jgi:hypothetical protein
VSVDADQPRGASSLAFTAVPQDGKLEREKRAGVGFKSLPLGRV